MISQIQFVVDITYNNWTLDGFNKKFEEAFNQCKEKGIISNS